MRKCAAVLGLMWAPYGFCAQGLGDDVVILPYVSYYPYNATDATVAKPASADTGVELRIAHQNLFGNYLCGAYTGLSYTLHIFPDGAVMLIDSCDVCPTMLLGEGNWTLQKTGIEITWSWRRFSNPKVEEFFLAHMGNCRKMTLLLGFKDKVPAGARLVSEELRDKFLEAFQATTNNPARYAPDVSLTPKTPTPAPQDFIRLVEYRDWQKVRARLRANAMAQP